MQSDGLWNGQRCARGQHLRKKNQGMNDFKKRHNVLVSLGLMRLKMPHWSDCLKKTISVNPVQFLGTFIKVPWPVGALALFKDYAKSFYLWFLFRAVSL